MDLGTLNTGTSRSISRYEGFIYSSIDPTVSCKCTERGKWKVNDQNSSFRILPFSEQVQGMNWISLGNLGVSHHVEVLVVDL